MTAAIQPAAFGQVRPLHPERAVTFRAWRHHYPVENCPALELAQTMQQAIAAVEAGTQHKTTVYVLQEDAGRGEKLLAVCVMRQESKAVWRRDPVTGTPRPERRAYLDPIHLLPVRAFEPVPPFDALRASHAEIVGIDPTLVEAG